MASKHFLWAVTSVAVLAAVGGGAQLGCGGESANAGGAGGGSSSSGSSSSHAVVSSSTGSGGGMGGNNSFAGAIDVSNDPMNPTMGTLGDPLNSADYYKFMGTKGEKLAIVTTAKTGMDAFDPAYLDLVVTLYDQNQQQIAQQDDPWPRFSNDPELYTVLPATGEYFIEVQECNGAFGSMNCAPANQITHNDYTIVTFDFGSASGNAVTDEKTESAAVHGDDTAANANAIKYTKDSMGRYFLSFLDGTFVDGTDVDAYAFTTPSDATVDAGTRANASVWIATSGKNGNGATSSVGLAWIADLADPTTVLAQLDGSIYGNVDDSTNGPAELSLPVLLGHDYVLFVQHPAGAAGSNDFYVAEHFVGGENQVELETVNGTPNTNDTAGTAEVQAMPQMNGDGSVTYFVEGDLPAGDLGDNFAMPSTGFTKASAFCGAQRLGSGLRGMKFELLGGATNATSFGAVTETATAEGALPNKTIPGATTQVVLQVTAASQDATVTSDHYRCAVVLIP